MADRRRSDERTPGTDPDVQASRLAELVAELTGTPTSTALHAVRSERAEGSRDALEVVAGAMVTVDQPPPEGFRLAGYLRHADGAAGQDQRER